MLILGLDPATNFGWAFYDTTQPYTAIESGKIVLPHGDDIKDFDKIYAIRVTLFPYLRGEMTGGRRPDFVAVEAPLRITIADSAVTSTAGQLAGATIMACLAWNIECEMVMPQTWRTIIPKRIVQRFPITKETEPEERTKRNKAMVKVFLDELGVVSPNMDSRDAAAIAIWARFKSPRLREAFPDETLHAVGRLS